jgi:hypothetical protein
MWEIQYKEIYSKECHSKEFYRSIFSHYDSKLYQFFWNLKFEKKKLLCHEPKSLMNLLLRKKNMFLISFFFSNHHSSQVIFILKMKSWNNQKIKDKHICAEMSTHKCHKPKAFRKIKKLKV